MNLAIILSIILESFVRTEDAYLLEFTYYQKETVANRTEFFGVAEIFNIILRDKQIEPKKMIELCVEATGFNLDTLKSKNIAVESNTGTAASVICDFFNNIDEKMVSNKNLMNYKLNILEIVLGENKNNISDLYNYAMTKITDLPKLPIVSMNISPSECIDEQPANISNIKSAINLEELIKDTKNLVEGLKLGTSREQKDKSIKLINDIIENYIDKLVDKNLDKDLFTFSSSIRIMLALLKLEKSIHDHDNQNGFLKKIFYYVGSKNIDIHYELNVLIVETFLLIAQNNRELIKKIKDSATVDRMKFLIETGIVHRFGVDKCLEIDKDNFYNIADEIISKNIENLDANLVPDHKTEILKLIATFGEIIEKNIYKDDADKWNSLCFKANNKITQIQGVLDKSIQVHNNSSSKKDITGGKVEQTENTRNAVRSEKIENTKEKKVSVENIENLSIDQNEKTNTLKVNGSNTSGNSSKKIAFIMIILLLLLVPLIYKVLA